MKYNLKVTFATLIIIFTFNMCLNNKANIRLEDDGGSYQSGFNCPSIVINEQSQGKGTFYPLTIDLPQTDLEKIGWKWRMNGPIGNDLKLVMIQKADFYYIPYRFIQEKFKYDNPTGSNKTLTGKVIDLNGKVHTIKILLPYALITSYINNDEGEKICNSVENNRNRVKKEVSELKVNGEQTAQEYITLSNNQELKDADTKLKELTDKMGPLGKAKNEAKTRADSTKSFNDKVDKEFEYVDKRFKELENYIQFLDGQIKANKDLIAQAAQDPSKYPPEINTFLDTEISNSNSLIQKEKDLGKSQPQAAAPTK